MIRITYYVSGEIWNGAVDELLLNAFGGATIMPGHGLWKDESGEVYDEQCWSIVVLVESATLNEIQEVGDIICKRLNQQSVYVTFEEVKGFLVEAKENNGAQKGNSVKIDKRTTHSAIPSHP